MKRQLYQCGNARNLDHKIRCIKGHPLSLNTSDGTINAIRLAIGKPLELTICQLCVDYSELGDYVLPEDRGWLK